MALAGVWLLVGPCVLIHGDIPSIQIWSVPLIAAIVLANKATLGTRNLKDYRKVPGLQVENWVD